ncbi:MAG: UDP-N-acetylmuramoyl-tripeptide--D-alanyl-D-alanine ligase [Pseudomonadota bacterium]
MTLPTQTTLHNAARDTQSQLQGADAIYQGVSTDTRSLQPAQLYIALQGPNHDGHHYLAQAAQAGAAGAIVSQMQNSPLSQIVVPDTRIALGQLAAAWRQQASDTRWIGITGSNGKTTLRAMIASILAQQHPVLATQGNLNNDIGLPLTLLRWVGEPYAVLEMGANHAGEIGYLSRIARPQIAVLNNAGRAHLEGFGSVAGVARAKAEIIQGLTRDGIFVYNADDAYASLWQSLANEQHIACCTFGTTDAADVRSHNYQIDWHETGYRAIFQVHTTRQTYVITQQLAGEHNRQNALAAIAVAERLDISANDIIAGLAALLPVAGRLSPHRTAQGSWIIDDSYNANADSVRAALQVLSQAPGRRTLVLGDLAETGSDGITHYTELGQNARQLGIERLLSCGTDSYQASATHGSLHFATRAELSDYLHQTAQAGESILIKGSRNAHLEQVVQQLCTNT